MMNSGKIDTETFEYEGKKFTTRKDIIDYAMSFGRKKKNQREFGTAYISWISQGGKL